MIPALASGAYTLANPDRPWDTLTPAQQATFTQALKDLISRACVTGAAPVNLCPACGGVIAIAREPDGDYYISLDAILTDRNTHLEDRAASAEHANEALATHNALMRRFLEGPAFHDAPPALASAALDVAMTGTNPLTERAQRLLDVEALIPDLITALDGDPLGTALRRAWSTP
ncbi:hypothetical protein [Deinococcus kurensis]|uniref:hypothetical protein n=1 Tax=Deinococcus kurensis TaxID=2662757 RepID=UPI0012D2DEFA|nr:hypothetical protein [Deinococcus kurensis]